MKGYPMDASSLHALKVARDKLAKLLSLGIDEFQRDGKCLSGGKICKEIEQFCHELCLVPECKQELHRRSSFVEAQCKQGADYGRLKSRTLENHEKVVKAVRGTPMSLT